MLRSRGIARWCELEVAVLDRSIGRRAFRRASKPKWPRYVAADGLRGRRGDG